MRLPGAEEPAQLGPAPFARSARRPASLPLADEEPTSPLGPAPLTDWQRPGGHHAKRVPYKGDPSQKKYDDLLDLLAHHEELAESLAWQLPASTGAGGTVVRYPKWKPSMRTWLREYYHRLVMDGDKAELYQPPPAAALPRKPGTHYVYFTQDVALHTYLSHVAWALYLDGQDLLPWKLWGMTEYDREEILASYRYHERLRSTEGMTYPGQPGKTYPAGIYAGHDFQPTYERWGRHTAGTEPTPAREQLRGELLPGSVNGPWLDERRRCCQA
ncbi:MAG: hypothetical protein HY744_05170 [Deltaproteobacteria bacterium]|nr:hypothetical protein [Deltaproteobacteria bacterium]